MLFPFKRVLLCSRSLWIIKFEISFGSAWFWEIASVGFANAKVLNSPTIRFTEQFNFYAQTNNFLLVYAFLVLKSCWSPSDERWLWMFKCFLLSYLRSHTQTSIILNWIEMLESMSRKTLRRLHSGFTHELRFLSRNINKITRETHKYE